MPESVLRIALAQVNPLVGDIEGNCEKILAFYHQAITAHQADIVVFPELVLTGYPPEDLLLRAGLFVRVEAAVAKLCEAVADTYLVVGLPSRVDEDVYNSAIVIHAGKVLCRYHKRCLPNYGVFDEHRYFQAGTDVALFRVKGVACAPTICEDIWNREPAMDAADAGAELLLNLNASPFSRGKRQQREQALRQRVEETGCCIAYVNQVGGQDEMVYDGASFVTGKDGIVAGHADSFAETLLVADYTLGTGTVSVVDPSLEALSDNEETYRALVTGVRDYIDKNGFAGAVIGLSGGIDSALTLAVAVDALGAERVVGVLMPSNYTADMSIEDAIRQSEQCGSRHHTIPIKKAVPIYDELLADIFSGLSKDTTEENIQARIRGTLLMAISNKLHHMVLTTGNKSEMAVGYATLYGDMAGGFAPLKDVPKTLVYALARWRNRDQEIIPQRVIDRPPTAELAPDQKDEDSLPPYPVLDDILARYVEQLQCAEEIIAAGHDANTVNDVLRMVKRNEYKRRQAAPGIKITDRAFGRERRYPITSGF